MIAFRLRIGIGFGMDLGTRLRETAEQAERQEAQNTWFRFHEFTGLI